MQVRDSVIIIFGEQRSHGDNVLRIVVFDGTEIAKLPFSGCIVGYDVGSLHVDAFAAWFGTYKVDFSSLQLSYIYLIAQAYDVLDRKSTRLNSSHREKSRMPSSA